MADIGTLMGELSGMEEGFEVEFEGSIALLAGEGQQRKAVMVYENKKFAVAKSPIGIILTEITDSPESFQIAFSPASQWMAHDTYLCIKIGNIQGACPEYFNDEIVGKYNPDEMRIR